MSEKPENPLLHASGIPAINIMGTQAIPASALRQTGSMARNAIGNVITHAELNTIHEFTNALPADRKEYVYPHNQVIAEKITSFRLTVEIPEVRSAIINFCKFLTKAGIDTSQYAQSIKEINVDAWISIITTYQRTDINTIDEKHHKAMWLFLCRLSGLLEHMISISRKYPNYQEQFNSLAMGLGMIFDSDK